MRTPSRFVDPQLSHLDAGERDAIALAEELNADQLIIDEAPGRKEANRRHLPLTGTLGVLDAAANQGLLNFWTAVLRLRQTNFHISRGILDQIAKSTRNAGRP